MILAAAWNQQLTIYIRPYPDQNFDHKMVQTIIFRPSKDFLARQILMRRIYNEEQNKLYSEYLDTSLLKKAEGATALRSCPFRLSGFVQLERQALVKWSQICRRDRKI